MNIFHVMFTAAHPTTGAWNGYVYSSIFFRYTEADAIADKIPAYQPVIVHDTVERKRVFFGFYKNAP